MRPFNKTTATLVRPHPFSTLCPTPLGNSPVWAMHHVIVSWSRRLEISRYLDIYCGSGEHCPDLAAGSCG